MTPEREAFEVYARKRYWNFPPQMWDGTKYLNTAIQESWSAWVAALNWKENSDG